MNLVNADTLAKNPGLRLHTFTWNIKHENNVHPVDGNSWKEIESYHKSYKWEHLCI